MQPKLRKWLVHVTKPAVSLRKADDPVPVTSIPEGRIEPNTVPHDNLAIHEKRAVLDEQVIAQKPRGERSSGVNLHRERTTTGIYVHSPPVDIGIVSMTLPIFHDLADRGGPDIHVISTDEAYKLSCCSRQALVHSGILTAILTAPPAKLRVSTQHRYRCAVIRGAIVNDDMLDRSVILMYDALDQIIEIARPLYTGVTMDTKGWELGSIIDSGTSANHSCAVVRG